MQGNYLLEPVLLPVLLDKKEKKEEAGEELPEHVIKNILYISNILFDIFSTQSDKTFVIDRNDELRIPYEKYVVLMDKIVNVQESILKDESVPWIDFSGKKLKMKKGVLSFLDSRELSVSDMYRLYIILKYAGQDEKERLETGKTNIQSVFKKLYKNPNGFSILSFDVDSVTRAIYTMEEAEIIRVEKNNILNKDGEKKFLYTIRMDKNIKKNLIKAIKKSIDDDVKKVIASFMENPSLYCCKECYCGEIYTFEDLEGIDYECPRCNSRKLEIMTDDDKRNAIDCFITGLPDIIGDEKKDSIKKDILDRIFNGVDFEDTMVVIPSSEAGIVEDSSTSGVIESRKMLKYLVIKALSTPPPKHEQPIAFQERAVGTGMATSGQKLITDYIQDQDLPVPTVLVPSSKKNKEIEKRKEEELKETEVLKEFVQDKALLHAEDKVKEAFSIKKEKTSVVNDDQIPYLGIDEITSMNTKQMANELLKRWIVATTIAMETLKQGSQRESRKKAFSMTKFFFFDSISKKYLFYALSGKFEDDRRQEAYEKIDAALSLLESESMFKINSFHPKFIEKGVNRFISMCESGEVYLHSKHSTDIENARLDFQSCKKPSKQKGVKKVKKEEPIKAPEVPEKSNEKDEILGMLEKIVVDVKNDKVKDGKELLQVLLSKFDIKNSMKDKKVDLKFFN